VTQRQAGVLLHPTSLPNHDGKPGVLNEQAWHFIDWLQDAGMKIWQVLPLTEPHMDLSPYQSVSAFAMNPALLPEDWQQQFNPTMFALYMSTPPHWLQDYALFMAIKQAHNGTCWSEWPDELKFRKADALKEFEAQNSEQIELLRKQQFMLSLIWNQLKKYANQKGVELFGDMPIFVAYDSVDVWANPQQFLLDENLNPTVVTGVPPDYFSETGQRWGNPHYNWERMQADGFIWWKERMQQAFSQFDLLRIDHFRGLEAVWQIDAEEETAINGEWVKTPGEAFLTELNKSYPDMKLVAEDLGIITDEVVALKQKFNLPGMSILQFGFNGLPDNPHSIHEQVKNSITYTGTHDNNTTLGWFDELETGTKTWVLEQLQPQVEEVLQACNLEQDYLHNMPWLLNIAAFNSVAERVIIPMQDILGLGEAHRMNIPGTCENNWRWQFQWLQVEDELVTILRQLLKQAGRSD